MSWRGAFGFGLMMGAPLAIIAMEGSDLTGGRLLASFVVALVFMVTIITCLAHVIGFRGDDDE